jgi:uncharacterized membrane protein YqhA
MTFSALMMMIITLMVIWGGFLYFVRKLRSKEKSKINQNHNK